MMDNLLNQKSTVLTPKQLSERWQISLAKVYEDNNAGLLPQLPSNKNRFPIVAIEEMEKEPMFDKENISTPRERRLEKEAEELKLEVKRKDDEITDLKAKISQILSIGAEVIYAS